MAKLLPSLAAKTPAAQESQSEREAFLTSEFRKLQDPKRIAQALKEARKHSPETPGITVKLEASKLPVLSTDETASSLTIEELEQNPGYQEFVEFLGKYKLEMTGDSNPTITESTTHKGIFTKTATTLVDIQFNLRANNAPLGRYSDPLRQVAAGMSIEAGKPKGDGPPPVPAP